jgi:integral membrane protein (TIGR01906 family)
VPVVLLLTSVQLVAFDRNYYRKEYLKYSISQHIGMNDEELMASTEKLLEYIEDKRDNLDFKADFKGKQEEFFSQRDKLHMIDVKMLFVNGRYIRNFSVLFIAVFLVLLYKIRSKEYFGSSLAKHGLFVFIAGTIPVIVLVILMNHDFYKYFTIFHEIFFNNDLWLLDPNMDRLVNIFPQEFFTDMAFRIAYIYIAAMIIVLIASLAVLRLVRIKIKQSKSEGQL